MTTRVGLVRCDFCQRQFNPHSAARHIPWCKKQQSESKRHRLSADKLEALERYRWRISYRPSNSNISSSRSLQNFAQRHSEQSSRKLSSRRGQELEQKQAGGRQRSSINSSATLSSPSASSTTSLSNSITSGNNYAASKQTVKSSKRTAETPAKLKRSVSSVTLTKRHGGVALTIAASPPAAAASGTGSRAEMFGAPAGSQPARAKSVSELSNMSEVVEILSRRMEEIHAQNLLLLRELKRAGAKHNGQLGANRSECNDGEDDEEFEECFHCRARCSLEANYCHKCGSKMRPSNPTPSRPD